MEKLDNDLKKLNLKKNDKNYINILLLGETGVDKSTFINAFVNYISYDDIKTPKKGQLETLIPTKFEITDKYDKVHMVQTGNVDNNERGESTAQYVKTYAISWDGDCNIRLIDTPKGVEQKENLENVLNYIGQLHEIHAICILFESDKSKNKAFFTYCINEILPRLDKSASDNLVFCPVHPRGKDYRQDQEAIGNLRKIVSDIQKRFSHIQIPLKRNIFCFDNEPFRYLTAVKCGVKFDSAIKEKYKESWTKSSEQCWKLIRYITGDKDNKPLKSHFIKSPNAVNEARRVINQLALPLADISQNIHDNMIVLKRHKNFVKMNEGSIEEMKKHLYVPVIVLEKKDLTSPTTVCTERKCAEVYKVSGLNKWQYKKCDEHCCLQNVPKELVGDPLLRSCEAMDSSGKCTKCSCTFMCHMHIYYITKSNEIKKMDDNVQKNISSIQDLVAVKNKTIKEMEKKESELQTEYKEIVKICSKFGHFLQNNAITPFNDAFKNYIIFLINREKSLGQSCDLQQLNYLENLLKEYQDVKDKFDTILQESKAIGENSSVTAKDINSSLQQLFNLKHNGKKIKELYDCQKKARTTEHKQQEVKVTLTVVKTDTKDKKEKEKKDKPKEDKNKNNKGNNKQNQGKNQASRAESPPPSYQDVQKGSTKANPPLPNRPTNTLYQTQPGPSQFGYNNYNGFPPNQSGPSNIETNPNLSEKYNINITVSENPNSKKSPGLEQTPNHPQYYPQNYNYPPNHPQYPPHPGAYYPPPPPQTGYPAYNFNPPNPNFQHNPNYPPPSSNDHHQGYDQHHGASGQQFRDKKKNPEGKGRGGSKGNRKKGDGAINKTKHEKKDKTTVHNKNKNKNKKEKKKESSSDSSDSSDSSSS